MSGRARVACGVLFAATFFGSFPHPLGHHVVDLGWALAWVAPALLLLAVRGLSAGRAAGLGFAAGTLANAAVLHWIYVVTARYGGASPAVGVLAPLLLACYPGAFTAAFSAGAVALARQRLASPLALALLWTALDHARSFVLSGFPWATLGYAQHLNAALTGLAAWTGVYGLSFATLLGSSGLLAVLSPRAAAGAGRRAGALALAGAAALHLVGLAAARDEPGPGAQRVRVAVLQGNIQQGVKWTHPWAERTLHIYAQLTRQAVHQGARVVVWPETAVPGSPDADPDLARRLGQLARDTGSVLVVGAVGIDWSRSPGRSAYRVFDSAFVFDAQGARGPRYDKTHLVPFGEYLPLRGLLGHFIQAIARGSSALDVQAGSSPRAVVLPGAAADGSVVTVGVPICYELIFPDLVRRFVGDGAQLLLAITNDAWYGRTGAPYQFLAMTALRSAETGTWTARAANSGVSAFVDARGRVRERTRIFERGFLVADVPLRPPGEAPTPYVRFGDCFAWGCWLGVLGLAVAGWGRARRRQSPESPGEDA